MTQELVTAPPHASASTPNRQPATRRGARGGVFSSILASVAFAALFGVPGMLTGLDSFATVGWRVLAALPFLVGILFLLRQWPQMRVLFQRFRQKPALLLVLALNSLLFGLQIFLFGWGPLTGNALAVSMGYFLMPLVVVAIGVLVFRERLGWIRAVAIALAAAGVVVAFVADANISWATFAVALGYPAYFVLRRKFELDSPAALALEVVFLAPLSLFFVLQPAALGALAASPQNLLGIVALGALTAIGFSAYSVAQRALPMSLFGLLGYLEPVLLVVVSVLLLAEPLGFADALSYGAIGLAIITLTLESLPRRKRATAAVPSPDSESSPVAEPDSAATSMPTPISTPISTSTQPIHLAIGGKRVRGSDRQGPDRAKPRHAKPRRSTSRGAKTQGDLARID